MSVSFYGCVSLDGYLADKNHSLEWLYQVGSIEETSYDQFYASLDITIMGKRTFDEIAKMEQPQQVYGQTENYVLTHAKTLDIEGFIPIETDIVDFVRRLPQEKKVWIIGGNQLVNPLLENDLIDQVILQIAPVVLGEGIPLFTGTTLKNFKLIETKQYGPFAELVYQCKW